MPGLLALGISHKTAPLDLRERVALPEGRAASVLSDLTSSADVQEAVALSTCNRTELYLVVGDPVEAETAALGALAREAGIAPTELADHLYSLRDDDAVRHLFRVASSLDAMIVGEAEIQGQVKRAYELALVEGTTGALANRLFRNAISCGKRVRSETDISQARTSLSSVAVGLAGEVLGDLAQRRVLVIGAGETGELTATALAEHGVHTVFVANRRYDRAIGLAQRFGGEAVRFDDLPAELERSDIVVSTTASPHQLVAQDDMHQVMEARGGRPIFIVDIAVPRDFDPRSKEVGGVHLYDLDDLQRVVERNRSGRQAEARGAEGLVEQEVERFMRWFQSLEVVPTIAALRRHATDIAEAVVHENASRWEGMTEADRRRVELMANAIASRLLHAPTESLRRSAGDGAGLSNVEAVRRLFDLDPEPTRPDVEFEAGLDRPAEQRPGPAEAPPGERARAAPEAKRSG